VRSDLQVPALLVYSSRYYLALAGAWNRRLEVIDEETLSRLTERVNQVRDRHVGES